MMKRLRLFCFFLITINLGTLPIPCNSPGSSLAFGAPVKTLSASLTPGWPGASGSGSTGEEEGSEAEPLGQRTVQEGRQQVARAQRDVPSPANALPWPAEDRSPCRGRLQRMWDKAVAAANVVVAVTDECADYLGKKQQDYIDIIARFAPIQPPQVGLTLMAEELSSKLGKHGTRCVLRGLVKGTMSPGAARDTAIKTIDAIGEFNDLKSDATKAMGIVSGLWRSGGLDVFQQDLGKARFEGLLDLKARDRLKGPKKYDSLFQSVRALFQDGESRSREAYSDAKESARTCKFKDSYMLFDRAILEALQVLNQVRIAIRSDQAELRCYESEGGGFRRPGLQVSIQEGMEEEERLRYYIHEVAKAKAAAQEEQKRVAGWINQRRAAMKEADDLIAARDLSSADSKLRHLENVLFKVCPDEREWQNFLALRRRLYEEKQKQVTEVGIPPELKGKRVVRTEKLEWVECWYSNPNVPCNEPNLETAVTIYHLEGGGAYWDRREYYRKRSEMEKAGYKFAWSCDKPLWRNGRCG